MIEKLKEVSPENFGKADAWNIRKFHYIVQTLLAMMFYAWIETTSSCSLGELVHNFAEQIVYEALSKAPGKQQQFYSVYSDIGTTSSSY